MLRLTLFCIWLPMVGLAAVPQSPNFALPSGTLEKPVRVRLAKNLTQLKLGGWGLRALNGEEVTSSSELTSFTVRRIRQGENFVWKIKKERAGTVEAETSADSFLTIDGLDIRRAGQTLPNRVVLFGNGEKFDLIGVLPLEDYVAGVVSNEMPLAWPIEALKAQAVAARSYTRAVMNERRAQHFDLETSVMDQVFNHIGSELESDPMIQRAKRAVQETKGVLLINEKGHVVKTYYHADCGGQTAPAKAVWGFGEGTTVVTDSYCPGNPRSKWSLLLTRDEIADRLSKKFGLMATIKDLFPLFANAKRAVGIKVSLEDGTEKILNADDFRSAVGYSDLRSTNFTVEKQEAGFEFKGRGWGHGVGLCQWGSRKLAEIGQSAFSILKHYYPVGKLTAEIKGSPAVISAPN